MLKNAYLLAKTGADAAKNEQHLANILPIGRRVAAGAAALRDGPQAGRGDPGRAGAHQGARGFSIRSFFSGKNRHGKEAGHEVPGKHELAVKKSLKFRQCLGSSVQPSS